MFAHLKHPLRLYPVTTLSKTHKRSRRDAMAMRCARTCSQDRGPFGLWTVVYGTSARYLKKKKINKYSGGRGNCRRGNRKSGFTCLEIFIISPPSRGLCVYAFMYDVHIHVHTILSLTPEQTNFHFSRIALKTKP